jgi:hypothetical protein
MKDDFEERLRKMQPRSKDFETAKRVLSERGYWRNKVRGKVFTPGNKYRLNSDK